MAEPNQAPVNHAGEKENERAGYTIYVDPSRGTEHGAADLLSSLLATVHVDQGCDVHENCNGFCEATLSTESTTKFQPNHSRPGIPVVTYKPNTKSADKHDVERRPPQDEEWLQKQQLAHFKYDSIDSKAGFIRLLKVKPAIYRADALECELQDFELSTAPPFEALSYHWGPAVFSHPMLCNGKVLTIAKSLHTALKRFRQCRLEDRLEYIWADAICINQSNKLELSLQVSQMRNIYSVAQKARIDLGECPGDWFEGFNLIHTLQFAAESDIRSSDPTVGRQRLFDKFGIPAPSHPAWNKYMELFASPWFTRTWIIQEVALAKDRMIFFGRFSFTWEMLVTSLSVLEALSPEVLSSGRSQSTIGYMNSVKIRQLIAWQNRPRSFLAPIYPLIITKDFESTDPRDKVIGLLGLIDEKPHAYNNGTLQPFQPDYTIDLKTFYHRHAIHLIDLLLGQGVLNFAGLHRRQGLPPTAPSWVVDWTAQSRTFLTSHFASLRPSGYSAGGSPKEFYATLASPGPGMEPDALITMATCFDRIVTTSSVLNFRGISPSMGKREQYYPPALAWYHEVHAQILLHIDNNREASASSAPLAYGAEWKDALARALLAGDTYTGNNATGSSAPIVEPAMTLTNSIRRLEEVVHADGVHAAGPGLQDLMAQTQTASSLDAAAAEDRRQLATFLIQMLTACRQRRFAITEKGRFALVPECADVGDEVCLIIGCSIAFVLGGEGSDARLGRAKKGPGRPLIGDAYVQGVMDGEMVGTDEFEKGGDRILIS